MQKSMLPVLHGSLEGFGQMAPYKASDGEHHASDPRYLADLCVPTHSVHGRQQLRSTASGTLLVPPARTATGQRSFAINGPRTCCWQVGSEPFVRRRCDCSASSATFTYIQTYLLTSIGPCYGMVPYMRLSFRPGAIIPEWKVVEMSNLVKIFSLARVINVLILG